jgi:N-acetylglucosaminyldiphosphoundecaprenol N-acetyl-beta-D-mannosaminyltransferase
MTHTLLGVRIDDLPIAELQAKLETWLQEQGGHTIVTPNAEFLLAARRNAVFKDLLNQSDLAVADSVSLQYAAAALSERLVNRLPGVDLLERLCEMATRQGVRVLFLGGAPSSAEMSAQKMQQRFGTLDVVAIDPGSIAWRATLVATDVTDVTGTRLEVTDKLVARINDLAPVIVAVALGHYKQEQFIAQVKDHCPSVRIWIGVGGAFEMISGQKRRAPHALSTCGLEWLWRLWIQPRRSRRIADATIVFPLLVAREAMRRHTLLRSTKNVLLEIVRQFSL